MRNPLHLFFVIFSALIFLAVLSICPWSRWTDGRLKDFNLLGGQIVADNAPAAESSVADNIDPELAKMVMELPADTIISLIKATDTLPPVPDDFTAPTREGVVLIEDYTPDGSGISRLASTLRQGSQRLVRVAMVGDSYIEGDILAQDIRAGLQNRFGGCGVGYVAAFSHFPGFRSSVNQASSGWEDNEIRKMRADDPMRTILGTYHTAKPGADSRYRGSVKPAHADRWTDTRVLFVAPSAGTITLAGPDNNPQSMMVEASDSVQCFAMSAPTADIRLTTDISGLKVIGLWLDGNRGVSLDDIALRGNSGVSHRRLSERTTAIMRQWIDYDLIILEFGMNALSAEQKDYSAYGAGMVDVVNNLKNLYPNAQIMLLGVGDRGTKMNGILMSMPTLPAMIRAQREVARTTGSLFYDTRAAMGGEGAAIDWHKRKLVNSDYVHLNHRGGKALADIFLKSLDISLQ